MAGLCIIVGDLTMRVAAAAFTLSWMHTVEKTRWEEHWRVEGDQLVLIEAAVEGSGAGMEPGPDAWRDGKVWRWRPRATAQAEIVLAGSEFGTWRLCADGMCRNLGGAGGRPDVHVLRACR
jgi:hypothetical protein